MVKTWNKFLKIQFVVKCLFAIQPIKKIIGKKKLSFYYIPNHLFWLLAPKSNKKKDARRHHCNLRCQLTNLDCITWVIIVNIFLLFWTCSILIFFVSDYLPISEAKYLNLKKLKRFCKNSDAPEHFAVIPHKVKQKINRKTRRKKKTAHKDKVNN